MSVDPRSRYHGSRTVVVVGADGNERTMLVPRVVSEPSTNGTYEVRPGDRLDLLGHVAFGDTTQWWRLADANPFVDAERLELPGTIMRLPDE